MGKDAERQVAMCRESRVVSKAISHRTTLVEVAASYWRPFLLARHWVLNDYTLFLPAKSESGKHGRKGGSNL